MNMYVCKYLDKNKIELIEYVHANSKEEVLYSRTGSEASEVLFVKTLEEYRYDSALKTYMISYVTQDGDKLYRKVIAFRDAEAKIEILKSNPGISVNDINIIYTELTNPEDDANKYSEFLDLFTKIEDVYKCPSAVLDKEHALNKIMEKYTEVRDRVLNIIE